MNAAERVFRYAVLSAAMAALPSVGRAEEGTLAERGGAAGHVPGVILVRLREGADLSAGASAQAGLPSLEGVHRAETIFRERAAWRRTAEAPPGPAEARLDRWRRIVLDQGADEAAALDEMRGQMAADASCPIEKAELDRIVCAQGIPDDPYFDRQYALHNTGQTGGTADADIDAPEAWDVETGSASVVIAIVDTGVEWTHPDLCDRIWQNLGEDADRDGHTLETVGGQLKFDPGDLDGTDGDGNGFADDLVGWDFYNSDNDPTDDYFHGTHCAGIAAASMNDAAGIAGVAPGCRIMPVKFLSEWGGGSCADAAAALRYAADMGANVLSNSWGGADCGIVDDAIDYAFEKNALSVFAAGNNGSGEKFYPAAYERAFAVASTYHRDVKSDFSNYGDWVDIAAPGEEIWSCLLGGTYGYLSGTSMATPHVAGIAGLLYSHFPGTTPDAVRNQIAGSADNIDGVNPGYEGLLGGGRANARQALAGMPTPTPVPPPPPPTPTPVPHGAVVLNRASLSAGAPFTARFRLDRSVKQPFSAYAVIVMPDGAMLNAATLSSPVRPLAAMMPGLAAPFTHTVVQTDVPAVAPRGRYAVLVAFFDPWGPVTGRGDAFFSAEAAFEIE